MIFRMIIEIKRFTDKCKKDNINAFAAQSAFFLIISLIPFVMVFCSLLQYTPVSEGTLLKVVSDIMPAYISPVVVSIIDEFYNKSIGIVSLTAVLAIWSAAKGVQYMADGLNVINGIQETRNWVVLRFWAVVYMIGFLLALLAALVLLVFGNGIQKILVGYFPFLAHATHLIFQLRSVIMLAVLIVSKVQEEGETLGREMTAIVKKEMGDDPALRVVGPAEASIGKLADFYRHTFYLRHGDYQVLVKAKDRLEVFCRERALKSQTVQFDFDPMNTY